MRNILIFVLIFIPIFAIIFFVYVKMFKKHVKPPEPENVPPPLSRRLELLRLRSEVTNKLTELSDVKEIKALTARLNAIDAEIEKADNAVADASDAKTPTP